MSKDDHDDSCDDDNDDTDTVENNRNQMLHRFGGHTCEDGGDGAEECGGDVDIMWIMSIC